MILPVICMEQVQTAPTNQIELAEHCKAAVSS